MLKRMFGGARWMVGTAVGVAIAGGEHLRSMLANPGPRERADEAAKELGYLLYRSRTHGTPLGEEADRLIGEITLLEESPPPGVEEPSAPSAEPGTATDPVCGMKVKTATARWKHELDGVTYFFCSQGCQQRFVKDPAAYMS